MTTDALFDMGLAWGEDVIKPGLVTPTPPELIARLTRPEREARVEHLVEQAKGIYRSSASLAGMKTIVGSVVLFSGGNDSTVLAHLFKDEATHAAHANTTIGIESTRQFVRDTCAEWGLPLIEKFPPTTYDQHVIEHGFPGPGHHAKMYQQLKERGLRKVRKQLVKNGRKERVIFIAGRRRAESARRKAVPLYEIVDSSVIFTSPLALWTKLDLTMYRLMAGDVPVNPTAELLGMSGECLCGSFAKPGELEDKRRFGPQAGKSRTVAGGRERRSRRLSRGSAPV